MRIFFYSTVFSPSVGGIETLVETLCRQFVELGHEVIVATETSGSTDVPFPVVRQPNLYRFFKLLRWCDIHIQANVSLKAAWVWLIAPGKIIYQHNNVYQRDDGSRRLVDRIKTLLARRAPGIANSAYTADLTGADVTILNAYDDRTFAPRQKWREKDGDLVFLGRLVSQKGCFTLIDALGRLAERGRHPTLTIIGEGPDRGKLEVQADSRGLGHRVRFLGELRGRALAKELGRHRVIVVPSSYEEPFGIVALEGLACGCIPVVSERGGLVDAISGHGFTFPNGDAEALAHLLDQVVGDIDSARKRLSGVDDHLARCRAQAVAERYIEVFKQHLECRL